MRERDSAFYQVIDARMAEARETLRRVLLDDFAASLQMPIEDVMRRNNAALGELIANPEEHSWA